ncbi:hypothetical protein [Kitasatospora sp. NPDC057936]|uniref:hypothetical protein n=1 Tax=Kitasatospora sp. NPDC057936 TaxID=3346283 RepID=UPI0036DC8D50
MTDDAEDRRGTPVPMMWALVVRQAPVEGQPSLAEAVAEFAPERHAVFTADALDSGLVLATGNEPPPTTAAVPRTPPPTHQAAPDRRAQGLGARVAHRGPRKVARRGPGPRHRRAERRTARHLAAGLADLPPAVRADVFQTALDEACAAGLVLRGTARLTEEGPDVRSR